MCKKRNYIQQEKKFSSYRFFKFYVRKVILHQPVDMFVFVYVVSLFIVFIVFIVYLLIKVKIREIEVKSQFALVFFYSVTLLNLIHSLTNKPIGCLTSLQPNSRLFICFH